MFDVEELRVENKTEHSTSLFIAAAIYVFSLIVASGVKLRKNTIGQQDYHELPNK